MTSLIIKFKLLISLGCVTLPTTDMKITSLLAKDEMTIWRTGQCRTELCNAREDVERTKKQLIVYRGILHKAEQCAKLGDEVKKILDNEGV